MNFFRFLRDHLIHFFVFLIGLLFANILIWIDSGLKSNLHALLYLDLLGFIFFFSFLGFLYWNRQNFYQELTYRKDHPEQSGVEPLQLSDNQTNKLYQEAYNSLISYNRQLNGELLTRISDQQDFITQWIHEIKVPIAALQLLIESVSTEIGPDKTKLFQEELNKTDHLVEQVLFYSRLDDFSNDYLVQKYQLKKIVKNVVINNMTYLLNKEIKFSLTGIDPEILTDEKWLTFILNQLLSNAIKYTPNQGEININLKSVANEIHLELKDTGIGIPSEDLPRIFEKGFTGQNGRKQNIKSTGLGLYLAKQLSLKLGHKLTVQSTVDQGSTFTLIFPFLSYYNSSNQTDNLK